MDLQYLFQIINLQTNVAKQRNPFKYDFRPHPNSAVGCMCGPSHMCSHVCRKLISDVLCVWLICVCSNKRVKTFFCARFEWFVSAILQCSVFLNIVSESFLPAWCSFRFIRVPSHFARIQSTRKCVCARYFHWITQPNSVKHVPVAWQILPNAAEYTSGRSFRSAVCVCWKHKPERLCLCTRPVGYRLGWALIQLYTHKICSFPLV